MKKEWIDINGVGKLYVEKVLITFDIPLLFVCITKENKHYLVLCENEEEGEYLISRCFDDMLCKMLQGKIAINSVFKNSQENILIKVKKGKCISRKTIINEELSPDMLPDEDFYYKVNNSVIR